jgi:integrase
MCIKIDEFYDLINEFEKSNPQRLAFALLGFCGIRSAELCNLTLYDISQDFKKIRFWISKKRKKYTSGTEIINKPYIYKEIPQFLQEELKLYIELNHQTFKNNKIFQFDNNSLRRYLGTLRERAKKGTLKSKELEKGLLETIGESISIGTQINSQYRITLHSFRRFYATLHFNTDWNKQIEIACRKLGHEYEKTTMIYLYRKEDINLNEELMKKSKINILLDKNQKKIADYNRECLKEVQNQALSGKVDEKSITSV